MGFKYSKKDLEALRHRGLIKDDGPPVPPLADRIAEEDFQSEVIRLAKECGWKHYHTRDSRKSVAGFPDLVLVRGNRVIFAELKRQGENPTADQLTWGELLAAVGGTVEYYLWRPSDYATILEILK